MNNHIENLNSILSKSPLAIHKDEFKYATELILHYKLKNQIMPLLRMQEYYLYFELPFIIKQHIDLLAQMNDERLNFFQLIGFVYFMLGSQKEFQQNLILFKYQTLGRMKKDKQLILHQVIGEIISPLWWHYELYRSFSLYRYYDRVQDLNNIIKQLQNKQSDSINLKILPKEFLLIVSNSVINNFDQEKIEQETDQFIAQLLKKDSITFDDLLNYFTITPAISRQKRMVYYKLLYYFWISCKAKQIQQVNSKPKTNVSPFSQSMIQMKETKSVQVSRIKTSQIQQSSLIKSQIFPTSVIQGSSSSNQIRVLKPSNLLLRYLQKNIYEFNEYLEDSDLENCFQSYLEKQIEILEQIQYTELITSEDIIYNLNNLTLLDKLQEIQIEVLVNYLDQHSEMLTPFILIMEGTNNLIKNLQYVCHQTEEYKYHEFPTLLSKFYYLPLIEQREILRIYGWQTQMRKQHENTIFRCLQLKTTNHAALIEVALRLKSIKSISECAAQRLWLSQIQLDDWSLLKGIIHQNILIQIFNFILQICLNDQDTIPTWQNLLKSLGQIINLHQTNDLRIHFFSFVVINFDFQQFLNLMSIHKFDDLNQDQCFQVFDFINKILSLDDKQEKLLYLKILKFLFAFSEDLYIDFLIQNIDNQKESLTLYYQLKNCQNYNRKEELTEKAQELFEKDDQFYKKFISPDELPEIDLSQETDQNLSKEQAIKYQSYLKSLLQLPEKEQLIDEILKLINQIKGNSKQIMKELDIQFLQSKTKSISDQEIFEFTTNQVQYIEKYVEQRVQQVQQKIAQKLKIFQNCIQQYQSFHQMIEFMNQNAEVDCRSKIYFKQEVLDQIEPDSLIFQLVDEFIQKKITEGKQLIKSEFQNIFYHQRLDLTSSKIESQIKKPVIYDEILKKYQIKKIEGKIYFLKSFLIQLESESNQFIFTLKNLQSELNNLNYEEQLKEISYLLIGCTEKCPFCSRKCDQDITRNHKHKCSLGHQIRSLGGVVIDGQPSLITCDELQDHYNVYNFTTKQIKKWSEWKLKLKKWSFQKGNELNIDNHIKKYASFWNDKIGKYVCNRLNIKFNFKFLDNIQYPHHYIFVIDESGSMGGQKWKNMVEAIRQCLTELMQNQENRVTIILYSDDARYVVGMYQPEEIQVDEQIKCLQMQSGGTNFETPFALTLYTILRCQNQFDVQTILFYTDGDAEYPAISLESFQNLPSELRKKIEILICCEGSQSDSLKKVSNVFSQKFLYGQIKESITTENIATTLLTKITTKY